PRPTGSRPGAVDSWFGPIQPNPQLSQEPTHSGDADANSCSLSEHQNEQFLCPRRTPVAVHLRRAFNEPKQLRAVGIGDLIFPIVFSPVSESHRAMLDEPIGDSVRLRLRAQATVRGHRWSLTLNETEDDIASTTHDRVRGSRATPSNLFSFERRKLLPC